MPKKIYYNSISLLFPSFQWSFGKQPQGTCMLRSTQEVINQVRLHFNQITLMSAKKFICRVGIRSHFPTSMSWEHRWLIYGKPKALLLPYIICHPHTLSYALLDHFHCTPLQFAKTNPRGCQRGTVTTQWSLSIWTFSVQTSTSQIRNIMVVPYKKGRFMVRFFLLALTPVRFPPCKT